MSFPLPACATPRSHHQRRHLLASAAIVLLLAATAAHAQSTEPPREGSQVVTNDQGPSGSVILAQVAGTTAGGSVADTSSDSVMIDDNHIDAEARINRALLAIDRDATGSRDSTHPTTLGVAGLAITGSADTLIVNRQASGPARAQADIRDMSETLDTGAVADSRILVTGNQSEAEARGNDASAAIKTSGTGTAAGAGIVGVQIAGGGSSVVADVSKGTTLTTGALSANSMELGGNRAAASAEGNVGEHSLTEDTTSLALPPGTSAASTVRIGDQTEASSGALFATLANQEARGTVTARAGDVNGGTAFSTTIGASADHASIAADGNSLAATATGNHTANDLNLAATSAASTGSSEASPPPLAALTNVQRADDAAISAWTLRGTSIAIAGSLTDSTVSSSNGQQQGVATANLADNRLAGALGNVDLRNTSIATDPHGTWVTPAGDSIAQASLALHNIQDYGSSSVAASGTGRIATISAGAIDGTRIDADGNSEFVGATGNRATNAVDLDAGTLAGSIALGNVQSGDGDVAVGLGVPEEPGGVMITPAGTLSNAELTANGNSAVGNAIGNTAANSLTLRTTTLTGDATLTRSGSLDDSYGAEGSVALANNQKLGQPAATPTIASNVYDRIGFGSGQQVTGSTIVFDDNARSAAALGNSAVNRLAVEATAVDGAGAALSATQYGEANVLANLGGATGTSGTLDASSVSISRNASTALAAINDADNALAVDAATVTNAIGLAQAKAYPLGPPAVKGDHALTSQQFAAGSATAAALTGAGNVQSIAGMSGTHYAIDDNTTIAEASANRAVNAASVTTTTGEMPGIALANSQTSIATVAASASGSAGYATLPTGGVAVDGSTIHIEGNTTSALARGNAADNRLALTTGGQPLAASETASVDAERGTVTAQAALLNGQTNYGTVSATATGRGYLPLNAGPRSVEGSSLTSSGNTIAASAYGNAANNTAAISAPGNAPAAGLANVQANYGDVTATVTGFDAQSGFRADLGALNGSTFTIAGNSLAATAVGNQATSLIASPR